MSCGILKATLIGRLLLLGDICIVVWTLEQTFLKLLIVYRTWLKPILLTALVERYLLFYLIMNLHGQTIGEHLKIELWDFNFFAVSKLYGNVVLIPQQVDDGLGVIFRNVDVIDLSRVVFGIHHII